MLFQKRYKPLKRVCLSITINRITLVFQLVKKTQKLTEMAYQTAFISSND